MQKFQDSGVTGSIPNRKRKLNHRQTPVIFPSSSISFAHSHAAPWLSYPGRSQVQTQGVRVYVILVLSFGPGPRAKRKHRWHCTCFREVSSLPSLEPGPTWLLIVLGRQERAWGPVKIEHYSSPLLGRKVTNNAARNRPILAGCAHASHGTASIESILSELIDKRAHPFCCSFLLLKVPACFTCLAVVMIRAGRSHGVEDHGNNTLSVLFKLKLEQMSCSSVDPKHCVSFSARRPFESPKFTKNSCKPGHGLSRKKKNAAELPVSQGTERMRLVLSSS